MIMMDWKKGCLVLVFVVGMVSNVCFGKSVFVANHDDATISAYDYDSTGLTYIDDIDYGTSYGYGAVDLAIDEESDTLFVSFEQFTVENTMIVIANARTLEKIDAIEIEDMSGANLTGLVFDASVSKLYATDRNTNLLHVLSWNSRADTIKYEKTVELDEITYACGLDIAGDVLYVSEFLYVLTTYDHIKTYDLADDFAYIETLDMTEDMVGFCYDPVDDVFYGGAYGSWGSHIFRRVISPSSVTVKNVGYATSGFAFDGDYVFVSSYRSGGAVEMWEADNWTTVVTENLIDFDTTGIDGPAGIALSEEGYLPNNISVTKDDGVDPNDVLLPDYVEPGDEITYTITIDPNSYDHGYLIVMDYLPAEVEYSVVDSSYLPFEHAYRWVIAEGLDATDDPLVRMLDVTVKDNAEPGGVLMNRVTVVSNVAFDDDRIETPVGCWDTSDVIYVDENSPGPHTGTSWPSAYKSLRDALARADGACGGDVEIRVADGVYRPGYGAGLSFEVPGNVTVKGGYAGYGAVNPDKRDWKKFESVLDGQGVNFYVVEVKGDDAVIDGFVITDAIRNGVHGNGYVFGVTNCVIQECERNGDQRQL